jgi:ATP-dependent helicase HrpA
MVEVASTPPSERYPGRPPEGRVVVIAPTRAACETIELGVQLTGVSTVIEREHGDEIRELARSGRGFGIMAGTGTGKTLAIRPIAQEIVGPELRVGVVNREREATPETPTWNVVIVTTGIARRWLQDDMIDASDVVIVDEIHQTSAELELCLALAKRAGCRFIWLSATVDPTFYSQYLDSAAVIESYAFDPDKAADVRVSNTTDPVSFLGDRFMRHVQKDRRGVAVFVPTRAGTEQIAKAVDERYKGQVMTEFYHGGEPVAKLRPFLEEDGAPHPFVLSMTAAGQSALNIRGLDTVVIEDAQFTTLVKKGKSVLTRMPLGANEILQMAGRVHGRVKDGQVWILSEREIEFGKLKPTEPHFQLAGDPERVAMTCADMGVRADELDLPVPLDRIAYRRAMETLTSRGIIANGRLTRYGREVEVLPVDRAWGELLVQADEHLVPIVATCASIESLHRMLRQQDNDIGQYVVKGSDHLTAYNIYQDALEETGSLGSVYGLPRHVFEPEALEKWCEERGVMMRSIEDAALAIASIFRGLDLELPRNLPRLSPKLDREWRALVARVMPFDLVIEEETSWGEHVSVSKTSVANSWGAVAGEIVYFADKMGRARGSISGTNIPDEMVWEFAAAGGGEVVYDGTHRRAPLRIRRTQDFHGFVLESDDEGINKFPEGRADECRRVLAEAVASGQAYHPDINRIRETLRELREVFRRSAGTTAPIDENVLTDHLMAKLAGINSFAEFMETPLRVDPDELVPADERARWMALPDHIWIADRSYPLDYALEDGQAIVRARIPAKTLNEVDESALPELDRPLHWTVTRGKHEAVRAATLDEARVAVRDTSSATRNRAREQEEGGSGGGRARGEGGRGRRAGQRKGHGGRDRNGGGEDRHGRGGRGGGGARHKKGGGKGGGRRKARH